MAEGLNRPSKRKRYAMRAFGLFSTTTILMAVILLGALAVVLYMASNLLMVAPPLQTTTVTAISLSTVLPSHNSTTTIPTNSINTTSNSTYSTDQIALYALKQINSERRQFGLSNVTLSNITSGQQHSESMLYYDYFSHWDTFGMKPYMRYTLLGGTEGVDENVAYNSQVNETCPGPGLLDTPDKRHRGDKPHELPDALQRLDLL